MRWLLLLLIPFVAYGGYNQKSGGYNSDLYPPQGNLTQWLNAPSGTNAVAKVGSNGRYLNAGTWTGDGATTAASGVITNEANTFSLTFYALIDKTYLATANAYIAGNYSGSSGIMVDVASGSIRGVVYQGGAKISTVAVSSLTDGWAYVEHWGEGGTNNLRITPIGGSPVSDVTPATYGTMPAWDNVFEIGSDNGTRDYVGELSDVTLTSGSLLGRWPLAEGVGSIFYDVSGNGNHISITQAGTWSQDATGEMESYNLLNGCSVWTNGASTIYVPYLNGSPVTNSVATYTLNREAPGGFLHNGAEVSMVTASGTNSVSTLQAMDGFSSWPIKNYYYYSSAPPSYISTVVGVDLYSGVYESP